MSYLILFVHFWLGFSIVTSKDPSWWAQAKVKGQWATGTDIQWTLVHSCQSSHRSLDLQKIAARAELQKTINLSKTLQSLMGPENQDSPINTWISPSSARSWYSFKTFTLVWAIIESSGFVVNCSIKAYKVIISPLVTFSKQIMFKQHS